MKEISLHILDIVQNSIVANATLIEVSMRVSNADNLIGVTIRDNGNGMSSEMLKKVEDPFVTTRTTRRVGMGIPLFKAGALATGGSFEINSVQGDCTFVRADYVLDHLDRPPIGDFAGTMHLLIVSNPGIDFTVQFTTDNTSELLDTREVRQVLGKDIPLDAPDVSIWIQESLNELFPAEYKML